MGSSHPGLVPLLRADEAPLGHDRNRHSLLQDFCGDLKDLGALDGDASEVAEQAPDALLLEVARGSQAPDALPPFVEGSGGEEEVGHAAVVGRVDHGPVLLNPRWTHVVACADPQQAVYLRHAAPEHLVQPCLVHGKGGYDAACQSSGLRSVAAGAPGTAPGR